MGAVPEGAAKHCPNQLPASPGFALSFSIAACPGVAAAAATAAGPDLLAVRAEQACHTREHSSKEVQPTLIALLQFGESAFGRLCSSKAVGDWYISIPGEGSSGGQ